MDLKCSLLLLNSLAVAILFYITAQQSCPRCKSLPLAETPPPSAPPPQSLAGTVTSVSEPVTDTPCGLWDYFISHNKGPGIHKWHHYFAIYEEHFGRFCRGIANLTMAEIGIQSGGSMLMWRHAFGEKLQLLVGLDTNPNTKAWEDFGPNVKVEIGSQADPNFLAEIKRKYPQGFDIFLDDGSHVPAHQLVTFSLMWELIKPGGVFLIEDLHGPNPLLHWLLHGHSSDAAALPGMYYDGEKMGGAGNIIQDLGDRMNKWNPNSNKMQPSKIQSEVESIKVYPYVVAITRRKEPLANVMNSRHGTQWIPYGKR